MPSLDEIMWLRSAEGQAICADMAGNSPADTPAAITRWRQRLEPGQVTAAWQQVLFRRSARAKFSRADLMLFDRVALEQATDEVLARHKAKRFQNRSRIADFCCGIGGDALALAEFASVTAIDWSAARATMAEHNACIYGNRIDILTEDAGITRPEADAAHIDPDRRPAGARRHRIEESSPGPQVLKQIVDRYQNVAVKLSPGADFENLPFDAEIELISHRGECKQAVAWTGAFRQARRRATAFPSGESIVAGPEENLLWPPAAAIRPSMLLFEPDPAVIRANLVGILARQYQLNPIDPHIACLVGKTLPQTTLLAAFRVLDMSDWSAALGRQMLARHNVGHVDIKTRGFAGKPEEVLKCLHPRGTRSATLMLTRIGDRPTAILAERVPPQADS
ncbi:MAG: hypothetical protein KA354_03840 [Phycisphaerae bacterium]|nr:hypothetical protein [Phycisphaerae bacterium]